MHRCRLLTALALMVVGTAGCAPPVRLPGVRPTRPGTPSPSRPAPTCSAAGTQLTAGDVDGAMGLRAMDVDLVNCGTRPIDLDGYPAARLFDKDHGALTVTVNNGVGVVTPLPPWEQPPAEITLPPGGSATSLLVWRNRTEAGPEGPTTAVFLDLAAGPGRAFEPVAMEHTIDLGTTGLLAVSPWVMTPVGTL